MTPLRITSRLLSRHLCASPGRSLAVSISPAPGHVILSHLSLTQCRNASIWTRLSRTLGLSPSAELQKQRDDVSSGRKAAAGPAPDGVEGAKSNTTPSHSEMQSSLGSDQRGGPSAKAGGSPTASSADKFAAIRREEQEMRRESIAERDARLQSLLLDRDGGEAAVSPPGTWEGEMGPFTKSQMFRVI